MKTKDLSVEHYAALYKYCAEQLMYIHGKVPTVIEVAIHMTLITNGDISKVLEIVKEIEAQKGNI